MGRPGFLLFETLCCPGCPQTTRGFTQSSIHSTRIWDSKPVVCITVPSYRTNLTIYWCSDTDLSFAVAEPQFFFKHLLCVCVCEGRGERIKRFSQKTTGGIQFSLSILLVLGSNSSHYRIDCKQLYLLSPFTGPWHLVSYFSNEEHYLNHHF